MELQIHQPPQDDMGDAGTTPEQTPAPPKPVRTQGLVSDIQPRGDYRFTTRPDRVAPPDPRPVQEAVSASEITNEKTEITDNIPDQPQPVKPVKNQSRLPIMIILIVVIVTGVLAVGMIYAFSKSNSKTKTTSTQPVQTITSIKSSDIDTSYQQMQKEIDGLNNSTDFGATNLNDQALGIQ